MHGTEPHAVTDPADVAGVKSHARRFYDLREHIWPPGDPWSTHTSNSIGAFVRDWVPANLARVLNAGAGGNQYGLSGGLCVNLDISLRHCRDLPAGTVGDVERLPFADETFDASVCVGAVVNYVRADVAIRELLRVTKSGGLVLLDFESSHAAELLFTEHWNRPVSVIERLYVHEMDKTYLYSCRYIAGEFRRNGASILGWRRYHTATSIWERIFKVALIPKAAFGVDRAASAVPGLRGLASSVLVACRKA